MTQHTRHLFPLEQDQQLLPSKLKGTTHSAGKHWKSWLTRFATLVAVARKSAFPIPSKLQLFQVSNHRSWLRTSNSCIQSKRKWPGGKSWSEDGGDRSQSWILHFLTKKEFKSSALDLLSVANPVPLSKMSAKLSRLKPDLICMYVCMHKC